MPKHYEALQRAEQERRRKASGVDAPLPAAVSFEGATVPAAHAKRPRFLAGLFRNRRSASVEGAGE